MFILSEYVRLYYVSPHIVSTALSSNSLLQVTVDVRGYDSR